MNRKQKPDRGENEGCHHTGEAAVPECIQYREPLWRTGISASSLWSMMPQGIHAIVALSTVKPTGHLPPPISALTLVSSDRAKRRQVATYLCTLLIRRFLWLPPEVTITARRNRIFRSTQNGNTFWRQQASALVQFTTGPVSSSSGKMLSATEEPATAGTPPKTVRR